jgi:hypothetical protein
MVDRFCAWALFLNFNGIRFDPPKSRFDDAGAPPAPGKAASSISLPGRLARLGQTGEWRRLEYGVSYEA